MRGASLYRCGIDGRAVTTLSAQHKGVRQQTLLVAVFGRPGLLNAGERDAVSHLFPRPLPYCFANTRYIDTCFTSAHSPCFANTCYIDTCFTSAHSPCFANTCYIDTGFSSAHSPCFANTCYIDTGFSSAHSPCFANTCYIETGFTSARLANNRRPCFANTCFTNDRFTDAWFVNVNDRGFLNAPGPRFTNDCGFLNAPGPRFTNDCGFLNVPSPCFTNDRGFSSAHARRQPISRADSSRCNDLRARPISNCPISIGPGGLIQSSAAHARDTTYESGAIFRGHSLLHFRSQYFFRATRCLVGPQPGRSSFHQLDLQRRFAGVLRPNASVDASATANSNAAISRQRKQPCAPDRASNRQAASNSPIKRLQSQQLYAGQLRASRLRAHQLCANQPCANQPQRSQLRSTQYLHRGAIRNVRLRYSPHPPAPGPFIGCHQRCNHCGSTICQCSRNRIRRRQ